MLALSSRLRTPDPEEPDNARAFHETLDPFLKAARKDTKDVLEKANPADIRTWAQGKAWR